MKNDLMVKCGRVLTQIKNRYDVLLLFFVFRAQEWEKISKQSEILHSFHLKYIMKHLWKCCGQSCSINGYYEMAKNVNHFFPFCREHLFIRLSSHTHMRTHTRTTDPSTICHMPNENNKKVTMFMVVLNVSSRNCLHCLAVFRVPICLLVCLSATLFVCLSLFFFVRLLSLPSLIKSPSFHPQNWNFIWF